MKVDLDLPLNKFLALVSPRLLRIRLKLALGLTVRTIVRQDWLLTFVTAKLKPIIMSTIAIMLGMMPLALGIGSAGAEIRQPMGIVSIGGLIVSAIFTLIVIPAIYNLTTKSKQVEV